MCLLAFCCKDQNSKRPQAVVINAYLPTMASVFWQEPSRRQRQASSPVARLQSLAQRAAAACSLGRGETLGTQLARTGSGSLVPQSPPSPLCKLDYVRRCQPSRTDQVLPNPTMKLPYVKSLTLAAHDMSQIFSSGWPMPVYHMLPCCKTAKTSTKAFGQSEHTKIARCSL